MKYSVVEKEFGREIYDFLIAQGYSHIFSLGVDKNENVNEAGYTNYRLEPLKPTDPKIKMDYPESKLQPIKCNDVLDMVAGVEFIRFLVCIPVKEFQVFLDINS